MRCSSPGNHFRSNQTLLFVGQDLESIQNYLLSHTNDDDSNDVVAGYMVYTNLRHLRGLDAPTNYGSGIEYADGLLHLPDDDHHKALQIGLWLHGTAGCREIVRGQLDAQIEQLFHYLMIDCGREDDDANKIYLRLGYEFDNPDFGYDDPIPYRTAFRTMVQYCHDRYSVQKCREKIDFVWHSWAATSNITDLERYYPGDDVVDWIGLSVFSQVYTNRSGLGNMETLQQVLEFASIHQKPTMIAESTPFGGIDSLLDPWEEWFQPVLDLIDKYDIGAWSYIDCDWESQPMWKGVGFGDTRLASNDTVQQLWQRRVLESTRFQVPLLQCHDSNSGMPSKNPLSLENSLLLIHFLSFHPSKFSRRTFLVLFFLGCVAKLLFHNKKRRKYQQLIDETITTEQVLRMGVHAI